MINFHRAEGELVCEKVPVISLIKEFGTPVYVYSKASIINNLELFLGAFGSIDSLVCFSAKSNSNLSILNLMAQKGVGADIVSGGELFCALKAGIDPKKIVFSGVGKTADELRYALKTGIRMFNIESEPELMQLAEIAESMGTIAPIALRVNPDIDAHTHTYTTTAKKENKFGLPLKNAIAVYKKASCLPFINPIGIDVHLGSPILSLEPYKKALDILSGLVAELRSLNIAIHTLDMGGGFGIVYKDEKPFTPIQFENLIVPYLTEMKCSLIVEPGRFIVGNSGVLLTKIIYVKQTGEKVFYICDAGMSDLIRPPLYEAYHEIVPVSLPDASTMITADVVGPICESSDFLAKNRSIERLEQNAHLAIKSAGAYGFSMASQYNSRPRACEILVDGASYHCIRNRETYDDLVRHQVENW
jgi:diaminopimelate decarboxylase